jgi:hypothetical protein
MRPQVVLALGLLALLILGAGALQLFVLAR